MSRSPAITSLLNGQAMNCRVGLDQRDVQPRIGATQEPRGGRAAEPAADHDDTRAPGRCATARAERATQDAARYRARQPPPAGEGSRRAASALISAPPHHAAIATLSSWRETLGDPVHHRRWLCAGAERVQRHHDLAQASRSSVAGGVRPCAMAARTARRARRRRRRRQRQHHRQQPDRSVASCAR